MPQKHSRTSAFISKQPSTRSDNIPGEALAGTENRNVGLSVSGQTARISMERPSVLNALSKGMFNELRMAIAHASQNAKVRYAIITGAGSAFSAGLDIREVESLKTRDEARRFVYSIVKPFWRTLFSLDKPLLALVNGPAYGAGAEIALASDIVIASPKATFAFSGGRVGALCCISPILGHLVMQGRKIVEMNLTGHAITAEEALGLGLANSIASEDKLAEEAEMTIINMEKVSPTSNSSFKRIRRELITEHLLSKAHDELYRTITSPDFHKGAQAFLAKQTPTF